MDTDKKTGTPDETLIATALERFKRCAEAESDNRRMAIEDIEFANGDQWDANIRSSRALQSRPCLTINRVQPFIRQVTNEQRQNRPAIKVLPVDSRADPAVADVLNGIVRHIEAASQADAAYDTAFEAAVKGGWGYFRILTDYAQPDSFDQDIRIQRIVNPFTVYLDCDAQAADYSDARYGFIVEDIRREDFKAQYPNADECGWDDVKAEGDMMAWADEDTVRVAEYFYVEDKDATLYLLADGTTTMELPEGVTAVRERKVKSPLVKWCKLTCKEVLERNDWAGKYIPIVPVLGDETHMDGKRILSGLTRVLRDPQQAYNFFYTATTEAVALTPKAPFIMAAGQDEGFEGMWANANNETRASLIYTPVTINGTLAPPPQRQPAGTVPTGLMQLMAQASDDMKAVSGIYDAALGNRSNETSGRAILARNQQSDTATFHYIDNLSRAIRHCGRIIVDLIPKIYDQARVARIIGADGEPDMVPVNAPFEDKGIQKLYDLSVGTYDVTVTTGPSYATKRQEAAETMTQLAQADPSLMQKAGDLIVKGMDFPGADDLAKRLKMFLPPEAQQDEGEGESIPPQIQAQMQQMDQTIQQLSQALEQASAQVKAQELKFREDTLKLREQMAAAKASYEGQAMDADQKVFETTIKSLIEQGVSRLEQMTMRATQMAEQQLAKPAETPEQEAQQSEAINVFLAVQESAQQTALQLQEMLMLLAAPKRVVRDASGLMVGVETVMQ